MTNDELHHRLLGLEDQITVLVSRVAALEDAHRAPRPAFEKCNGDHHGHPCADPECWILRRYKEQQKESEAARLTRATGCTCGADMIGPAERERHSASCPKSKEVPRQTP